MNWATTVSEVYEVICRSRKVRVSRARCAWTPSCWNTKTRPGITGVCLAVTFVQVSCCDSILFSVHFDSRIDKMDSCPDELRDADRHRDWLAKGQVSFEAVGFRRRPSFWYPNGRKEYLSNMYELPKNRITWRPLSNWWCKCEQSNTNNFTVVYQFGTSAFNTVVLWCELGEVGNECTSHNFSLFVILLPKIIKIGGNVTKFWQKQFCTVFLRHGEDGVHDGPVSLCR